MTAAIPPEAVMRAVCKEWRIKPHDLLGSRGKPDVALARQAAMTLVMDHSQLSRTETASLFDRDYTTVLWAEGIINKGQYTTNNHTRIENVKQHIKRLAP